MAETIPIDCPSGSATVSASALALHLGCSRTYIGKLEAEGVMGRCGVPRRVRDHREGAQTAAVMRGGARCGACRTFKR